MVIGYRYPVSLKQPLLCGAQAQPFFQSRELVRRGHKVTVICRKGKGEPAHQIFDGVEIIRYQSCSHLMGDNQSASLSMHRFFLFNRLCREGHFDVILTMTPLALESNLAKGTRPPIIYINHGVAGSFTFNLGWNFHDLLRKIFIKFFSIPVHKKTLSFAGMIVGVCQDDLDILHTRYHVPREKMTVIYNGIDTVHYRFSQKNSPSYDQPFKGKSPNILFVGRISKEKGLHYLIKSMPMVLNKYPQCLLIVVGNPSMPSYALQMKNMVNEMGLQSNIQFFINLPEEELPYFYSLADVCSAYSSGYDPFPNTLLQAMSCGVPVISNDCPARRELVKHNHTGIMVPENNPQALAQAIIALLDDRKLRFAIGVKARSFVEGERNLEKCVQGYERVCSLAINQNARA